MHDRRDLRSAWSRLIGPGTCRRQVTPARSSNVQIGGSRPDTAQRRPRRRTHLADVRILDTIAAPLVTQPHEPMRGVTLSLRTTPVELVSGTKRLGAVIGIRPSPQLNRNPNQLTVYSTPNRCILRQSVLRSMPSICAANVLFPSALSRASAMISRSSGCGASFVLGRCRAVQ